MTTIYRITQDIEALQGLLEDEENDGNEAVFQEWIDELAYTLEQKADSIAHWRTNQTSLLAGIYDEVKILKDRAARIEKHVTRVDLMLFDAMKRFGTKNVVTPTTTFSITRPGGSPPVDCPPVEKLPAEYVRTTITTEPDKKRILIALQAGQEIPGCSIRQRPDILKVRK